MHRSWNFKQRIGGAMSIDSGGLALPTTPPKGGYKSCNNGKHKWMHRKWTRKCTRCGTEQSKDALGKWE